MRIQVARGPLAWWLRRAGYAGITLPPLGIYLLGHRIDDVRLRRHEAAHWQQYRQLGLVRFYVLYLWWLARVGYELHPFEIQARRAERGTTEPSPDDAA
jgi:hypothetical protein